MLRMFEELPVELMGMNVLSYLSLEVMLERVCASKETHQAFMEQIPHCTPCELLDNKIPTLLTLQWFAKRKCRLLSVGIQLTADSPVFDVTNLMVIKFRLLLDPYMTTESLKLLIDNNMGSKVIGIDISGNQNSEVIEGISACTRNVEQLTTRYSYNCMDWLTANILSKWKLQAISLYTTLSATLLIAQTCTELTRIKLYSDNIDDAAVIAIAQHCPKLETLLLRSRNITWTSLVALSERGLPLKELNIDILPYIPTANIARRCSHALSCIRHLSTNDLVGQDATILIPYMTGLTSVGLNYHCSLYMPLLIHYCHILTKLQLCFQDCSVTDILSLCRANPLLQELVYDSQSGVTDTTLIKLTHVCPNLHTLWLSHETDITDIGILALSEHCPQLQMLDISNCKQVTEIARLQLLQRCRKLTYLTVSNLSLSAVAAAQGK